MHLYSQEVHLKASLELHQHTQGVCVFAGCCGYRGVAAQVEEQVVLAGGFQGQTQRVEVTRLDLRSVGANTIPVRLDRHLDLRRGHIFITFIMLIII